MIKLGYKLSSEEHPARDLVEQAQLIEQAGFHFGAISDHYHPWTYSEGHSPFVWSVLGGIAATTEEIEVYTAVTCPTMRIHPAIIAQAAATTASMMPGRFALGVGSGELLNEHILGDKWPTPNERLKMLEEAVLVMRLLWTGEKVTHHGKYFTVEDAQIYSLPNDPPPIFVAASSSKAARFAGRQGNALIATAPSTHTIETFRESGGANKPIIGEIAVCWGSSETEAKKLAHQVWPITAMGGSLTTDTCEPADFVSIAELLSEEQTTKDVPCGPDPERHLEAIQKYVDAGFDHIFVHQIGHRQREAIEFYQREVMPRLSRKLEFEPRSGPREAALAR